MSNPTNLPSIPPPPPPVMANFTPNRHKNFFPTHATGCGIDECSWADAWPELQKACFLCKVCTYAPPKACRYNNIPSILQKGPTCGLAALSMLLNGNPTAEELLKKAKQLNYTNNGEMFSAKNLFKLICDTLTDRDNDGSKTTTVTTATVAGGSEMPQFDCQMYEGQLNCAKVRDCLLNGACIFIAYDPDFNNLPCLKYGHKAHWALIIGYLIDERDEFYVIARHGKSKNLAVWSLKSLSASNSNLEEFSQPIGYPNCEFLLPKDGIGGELGLKNQAIIVSGWNKETFIVR
ncbi:actin maturation protease [Eupeodes corollae]|uniref:actin maturation protease n=1 Tax=Eupeodes corollae TaxID=290404 RepID=UPI002491FC4C|nr:actin maturation protease [Eupeodes corollae]